MILVCIGCICVIDPSVWGVHAILNSRRSIYDSAVISVLQEYPWSPPQYSWLRQKSNEARPGMLTGVWLCRQTKSNICTPVHVHKHGPCYLCIQYATWQESGQMMQMQWNWRFASTISPHHSNGTCYFLLPVLLSRWQQAAWVKILTEAAKSIRLTLHMPAPLLQVNLLEPTHVKSQMKKWKNVVWGKTGRTWQRESNKVKIKIIKTKWALLSLSHISHVWETFSHSASERQKNRLLHFTCGNQPSLFLRILSLFTHMNLQRHITQLWYWVRSMTNWQNFGSLMF